MLRRPTLLFGAVLCASCGSKPPGEKIQARNSCVQKIQDAGDPGYIVSSSDEKLTRQAITRHAQSFGWDIKPESTEKAITFLDHLNLVKTN